MLVIEIMSHTIPTLLQSKSFIFGIPRSQSLEPNANLAIRPKQIISNILVLIPVINEIKWYINCLCTFFPFAQWTQWRTVTINQLFSQRFYWIKLDRILNVVYKCLQHEIRTNKMHTDIKCILSATRNLYRPVI